MNNTALHGFITYAAPSNVVPIRAVNRRYLVQSHYANWKLRAEERLNELVSLEQNWDGYGAGPVLFTTASFAIRVLEAICFDDTSVPEIIPGTSGDLQIEWHEGNRDIEIHVIAPNRVHACYRPNVDLDQWKELTLTNDFAIVADWIKSLGETDGATSIAAAG